MTPDPRPLRPTEVARLLDSAVDTPREELTRIRTPTLVAVGADDEAHRSAGALAQVLPNGRLVLLPGNHMSAVTKPELALAIADFLADPVEDGGRERI